MSTSKKIQNNVKGFQFLEANPVYVALEWNKVICSTQPCFWHHHLLAEVFGHWVNNLQKARLQNSHVTFLACTNWRLALARFSYTGWHLKQMLAWTWHGWVRFSQTVCRKDSYGGGGMIHWTRLNTHKGYCKTCSLHVCVCTKERERERLSRLKD